MSAARSHAQRFGGMLSANDARERVSAVLIHYDNDRLSTQPRWINIDGAIFQYFGVLPPVARIGGVA